MSEGAKKELPPPSLGRTIFNLLPLVILTLYLCNNRPDKSPQYQLEACGKHLHAIAVDLEKDRYRSEDGLYSATLAEVFHTKELPACPLGGKEAYETGYQPSEDRTSYVLVCKGNHHKDASVPSDYPRIAFSVLEAKAGASPSPNPTSEVQDKTESAQTEDQHKVESPANGEKVEQEGAKLKEIEPEKVVEGEKLPTPVSKSPSPQATP